MRILLVNKFYYIRGGDCTAVFNTERLLKDKGHEVAIFSMQNPDNVRSPWEGYFPKEVDFSSSNLNGKFSAAMRIFHAGEVKRKFERLLADFRPDVVHLHNIHSYLSPLVAQVAHKKGIRVVWTLHDHKLICPSYLCLRDGKVCEACFKHKSNVIRHKCMKNSYTASVLAYLEACCWNKRRLSRITDTFISPSHFLKTKMTEAGFSPEQIEVLPNFISSIVTNSTQKENYYCYTGRLSKEKGIETLLESAKSLPYPLKIIGDGPLLKQHHIQKQASGTIEFCGRLSHERLYPIVQKALLLVIPSVCYENSPFSAIEALCMGTPVLGSRIGGIPELIEEGENGFLARPGDRYDLRAKIIKSFQYFTDVKKNQKIATEAQNKFGSETFYSKLMNIYER